MSDEGKTEQNEYDPQAPKYMRPRRPVLDEPLDGFPEDAEVPEHEAGDTDVQPEPALEPTQELKAQPEPGVQEAWIGVDAPSKPGEIHSPYFPHGIYEDAQTVEAYYGRGSSTEPEEKGPSVEAVQAKDSRPRPLVRWLIPLFALLMILALLFLALTEGIPLGFF